jgi:hypothetical protein
VPAATVIEVTVALKPAENVVFTGSGWSSRCWYFGLPDTACGARLLRIASVGVAFGVVLEDLVEHLDAATRRADADCGKS